MFSIRFRKTFLLFAATMLAFGLRAGNALAETAVAPAVLDRKAVPRDILKEAVSLKNTGPGAIQIYPLVQDVEVANGRQEFLDDSRTDLSRSLAHWISMSRAAIRLGSGEEQSLPLEIRVNYDASPGVYHAALLFPSGSTRAEAETQLKGAPFTLITVEVLDTAKENLGFKSFKAERRFMFKFPANFTYELENTGDLPVTPGGDILIYNRNGQEVGAIPANPEGVALAPKDRKEIKAVWNGPAGVGQYKAVLNATFGSKNPQRFQDTVFFWIVPLPWAFGSLIVVLAGVFFSMRVIFGKRPAPGVAADHNLWARNFPHMIDLRHPDKPKQK